LHLLCRLGRNRRLRSFVPVGRSNVRNLRADGVSAGSHCDGSSRPPGVTVVRNPGTGCLARFATSRPLQEWVAVSWARGHRRTDPTGSGGRYRIPSASPQVHGREANRFVRGRGAQDQAISGAGYLLLVRWFDGARIECCNGASSRKLDALVHENFWSLQRTSNP